MCSFYFIKKQGENLHYILKLQGKGLKKTWLIPYGIQVNPGSRRIAIEQASDYKVDWEIIGDKGFSYKGPINIIHLSKSKIIFQSDQHSVFHGKFVLRIPSWGRLTKKKIWVLIQVS